MVLFRIYLKTLHWAEKLTALGMRVRTDGNGLRYIEATDENDPVTRRIPSKAIDCVTALERLHFMSHVPDAEYEHGEARATVRRREVEDRSTPKVISLTAPNVELARILFSGILSGDILPNISYENDDAEQKRGQTEVKKLIEASE